MKKHILILGLILSLLLSCAGCSVQTDQTPAANDPTLSGDIQTDAPTATEPPATESPATEAPTEAPTDPEPTQPEASPESTDAVPTLSFEAKNDTVYTTDYLNIHCGRDRKEYGHLLTVYVNEIAVFGEGGAKHVPHRIQRNKAQGNQDNRIDDVENLVTSGLLDLHTMMDDHFFFLAHTLPSHQNRPDSVVFVLILLVISRKTTLTIVLNKPTAVDREYCWFSRPIR